MGEFELIRTYFSRPLRRALLGGGDDCALLRPRPGVDWAISTDMLVEGRHFAHGTDPQCLGWKCLAVNLSDLAAMGAQPLAFTLALALPEARATWLGAFAAGLYRCADRFDCELIGGDTTRGPLAISITVIGELPPGTAVTRAGARPGDDIWVSGTLGGAALGLRALRDKVYLEGDQLRRARCALDEPEPRIALGLALRDVASAMLDISDGLAGDMGHIAAASRVAAHVNVDGLPRFAGLAGQSLETQLSCLLCGGDDYELCFTAARERRAAVAAAARAAQLEVARVGHVARGEGVHFEDGAGAAYRFPPGFRLQGFDHFG